MQKGEYANKCTILLGSGADTDCCGSLPSGQAFVEALLKDSFKKERAEILGNDVSDFHLIYHNSRKIYAQTIYLNQDKAEEQKVFTKKDIEKFIRYYKGGISKVDALYIKKECKSFYDCINGKNRGKKRKQQVKFFLENAVFFDAIDGKFNLLQLPDDANPKIRFVKNAYLTIYLLILEKLYAFPEDFQWSYESIIEHLNREYEIEKCCDETYYDLIRKSGKDFYLVTTNYTKLAEKYSGKDVTYLHGKMTWFEDLRRLTIYDCDNAEEKKTALCHKADLLPFILIPSGVKPLIAGKQIRQFSDFMGKLRESRILCVVGYKFHKEDNHINSLIADWLREEDHRMVYFNFNGELGFGGLIWAEEFKNEIENASCFLEKLLKNENKKIINIKVDKDTSRKEFEKFLSCC